LIVAVSASIFVIPAKAGIHFDFPWVRCEKSKMDPGFRRDDGVSA
jgi:hypothetical protein